MTDDELKALAKYWEQSLRGQPDGSIVLGALRELQAAHEKDSQEQRGEYEQMIAQLRARLDEAERLLREEVGVDPCHCSQDDCWFKRARAFLAPNPPGPRTFEQLVDAVGELPSGQLAAATPEPLRHAFRACWHSPGVCCEPLSGTYCGQPPGGKDHE